MIPSKWDDCFFFSVFKGEGEDTDRGNYHGLRLTEHVLKVVDRIIEVIIRYVVTCSLGLYLSVVQLMPFSF